MIAPEEVNGDCVHAVGPKLLEDIEPELGDGQTSVMEFAAHDDHTLSVDYERSIVPLNNRLKAIVGGEDPQQHSKDAEDKLREPHDGPWCLWVTQTGQGVPLIHHQSSEDQRHDGGMIISPHGHLIHPIAGSLIYRT